MEPWAIDDLIINDGFEWNAGDYVSILRSAYGLPAAGALLGRRTGRWPLVTALARTGRDIFLETIWRGSINTTPLRRTARRQMLQYLSPELLETSRFTVVDHIPPGVAPLDVLLAMGPWDVYATAAGTWHVRDLLNPTTIEADITGAVHFEDGHVNRVKAIVIEEVVTNEITNPTFEVNTAGWASGGLATMQRTTDESKHGNASLECLADSSGDNARVDVSGLVAGGDITVFMWVKSSDALTRLRVLSRPGNAQIGSSFHSGSGEWEKLTITGSLTGGETVARVQARDDKGSGWTTFYVDKTQLVELDHNTTYVDGASGPEYAWTGPKNASASTRAATEVNLDDHSSLLDDNESFAVELWARMPYAYNGAWPIATDNYFFHLYEDASNEVKIAFDNANNQIVARYEQGGSTVSSVYTQTFSAGDWVHIVANFDTAGNLELAINGTIRDTDDLSALETITPTEMNLGSDQAGANQSNAWFSEFRIYNRVLTTGEITQLYDDGAKALRARWLDVVCERADPLTIGGIPTDQGLVSTLAIHGDVRYRSRDGDVAFARLYDDSEDFTLTVDSDDDVYPIIRLTPKTAKTTGFAYKRWVPVHWKALQGTTLYPVMITQLDTAAIVGAAKAQADGDDWRVFSNGVEIDRWFGDAGAAQFNQAGTRTWVNLDFQATISLTAANAILIGDTVATLDVNEDISGMPSEGIVMIASEAFVYTSKNNTLKRFLNVTRAAKGTSAAGHAVDADVKWIQNDVWIYYGNPTATAPDIDDDYKPVLSLESATNDAWVWETASNGFFGDNSGKRTAAWVQEVESGSPTFYTANRETNASPWEEIGIKVGPGVAEATWSMYNPCGITEITFFNGEQKSTDVNWFSGRILSADESGRWSVEFNIPAPAADDTWEPWSRVEVTDAGTVKVGLNAQRTSSGTNEMHVEAADANADINTTYAPDFTTGVEQGNYTLSLTIANAVTDESILVEETLGLNETIEADSNGKKVTNNADGSRLSSPSLLEGPRRDWLRLVDGDNVLTLSDTGTAELEIDFIWDRRYFE